MPDRLYEANLMVLYPATILLVVLSAELGVWIGRRRGHPEANDLTTISGAALGLLGLLLAFSFSLALSRYDTRRNLVLEEANAIGSTANFALMLPAPFQEPIFALLREYATVRIGLGVPYDPAKMDRDVARSVELQAKLWQQAVVVTTAAPQSLPAYRFVASLNEMNNIHEARLTALRYHVPGAAMLMLIGVAMISMGLAGCQAGMMQARRRGAMLLMSITIAAVIVMVFDLDQPARGLIRVSNEALVDAAHGIPQ